MVYLYTPLVYRWCAGLGVRGADADDVSQEVFQARRPGWPGSAANSPATPSADGCAASPATWCCFTSADAAAARAVSGDTRRSIATAGGRGPGAAAVRGGRSARRTGRPVPASAGTGPPRIRGADLARVLADGCAGPSSPKTSPPNWGSPPPPSARPSRGSCTD